MNVDMEERETKSISSVLKDLKVDDSISFPILKKNTVKNCCYYIGRLYDRKFETSLDRKAQLIHVTRIK